MKSNKVYRPNIVGKGKAIPLGANYYYMQGAKHSHGGIKIGKDSKKGIEVEGEEIMHVTPSETRVFSSVPFLNGESPAEKILGGENPNKVFKQQEDYKDLHNLNDDGTKKNNKNMKSRKYGNGGNSRKRLEEEAERSRKYVKDKYDIKDNESYSVQTRLPKGVKEGYVYWDKNSKSDRYTPVKAESIDDRIKKNSNFKLAGYNKPNTVDVGIDNKSNKSLNTYNENKGQEISLTNRKPFDYTLDTPINKTVTKQDAGIKEEGRYETSTPTGDDTQGNMNAIKYAWGKTRNYVHDHPNVIADVAGTGANIIGAIAGYKANKKAIDSMRYAKRPAGIVPAKLKTKINIEPQLTEMRDTLASYERSVDANTASSKVAMARKLRARIEARNNANELHAQKENAETQLINRDKLNAQQVAAHNAQEYNKWAQGKAAFDNHVAELRAENSVGLTQNLVGSVRDLVTRFDVRRKEESDLEALRASNPHVAKYMEHHGFKTKTDERQQAYNKRHYTMTKWNDERKERKVKRQADREVVRNEKRTARKVTKELKRKSKLEE